MIAKQWEFEYFLWLPINFMLKYREVALHMSRYELCPIFVMQSVYIEQLEITNSPPSWSHWETTAQRQIYGYYNHITFAQFSLPPSKWYPDPMNYVLCSHDSL